MTLYEVTYNNGRTESVAVTPADRVDFERRYGCPMSDIDPVLTEHSLYLAYTATLRTGRRNVGTFSRWMETVADVTAEDGE